MSTISIDRLSPETITAIAIDLGELPTGLVMPKASAPVHDASWAAKYEGQRVRLTIIGRKMTVPGRVTIIDGVPHLATNWGAEIDLTKEQATLVEQKDQDSGRFVPVEAI